MDDRNIPPVCLSIAGLDPSGGAGTIADIKTFSAFGCFAAAAIASVTFQNTTGVFGAAHQSADAVLRQVTPIVEDYTIAAVKTGMLPTSEVIAAVADLIQENNLKNVVVDPVVRSTSGFDLIDDQALDSLIDHIFPLAVLITPNIAEAERIARIEIRAEQDIVEAANKMRSFGAKNILIKGGHFVSGDDFRRTATDYLFTGESLRKFEASFLETSSTHGTGCVLSAAIAANLALGRELDTAIEISKSFVHEAIRTAPGLGKGHSPINI